MTLSSIYDASQYFVKIVNPPASPRILRILSTCLTQLLYLMSFLQFISVITEMYSEHFQTSFMELFSKIVFTQKAFNCFMTEVPII